VGPNPLDDAALGLGEIGVRAEPKVGAEILEDSGDAAAKAAVTVNREKGLAFQMDVLRNEGLLNKTRGIKYPGFKQRFPDALDGKTGRLAEVKAGKSVSFTKQLRDYFGYCEMEGLTFHLYVRAGARISKRLQSLVDAGKIVLHRVPE